MTITLERPDLSALTDDELADLAADPPMREAVAAEAARRGTKRRREAARINARRLGQAGWFDMAYAQYLQAESATCGVLLSKRGLAAGIDPWLLWSGPENRVTAYASCELLEFWQASPRITVTEYQRQERRAMEVHRDEMDRDAEPGGHAVPGRPGHAMSPAVAAVREAADRIRAGEPWRPAQSPAAAQSPAPAGARAQVAVREPGMAVTARREIDGDQVLRYLYTYLKHFAHWGSDAEIVAAAAWIAHTHARDGNDMPVWQYCARLGILGPSGSGKSWKSRLIGKLACSGEILVEPTKPAFIDLCAENHTVIMTEADEAFRSPGRSRGILAVVNASYEPDRTTSRKQGGVAVKIPLFCHIVLDGIDDVLLSPNRPDLRAMMSRCLILTAAKAPDGYRPPRFDRQARDIAAQLGQLAGAWMAQEVAGGMAGDEPPVPEHLGNRPFALWEPLFTVALRADKGDPDGPWSAAMRDACEVLEAGAPVIDGPDDELSELDRQMAEWGEGL